MTKKKKTSSKVTYYQKPSYKKVVKAQLKEKGDSIFVKSTPTLRVAEKSLAKQEKRYEEQQGKILAGEIPTQTAARLQNLKAKLSAMASKTMRKPPVKMIDVGQKKRMVVRLEQPPEGARRFALRQIYSRQTPYNPENILKWK